MTIKFRHIVYATCIAWVAAMGLGLYAVALYDFVSVIPFHLRERPPSSPPSSSSERPPALSRNHRSVRSERPAPVSEDVGGRGLKPGAGRPFLPYVATMYHHGCVLPVDGIEGPPQKAANNQWPVVNETIAADPSIPFGTQVEVSHGNRIYRMVVGDRGRAIKGNRIDLFGESCDHAVRFGRKTVYVRFL